MSVQELANFDLLRGLSEEDRGLLADHLEERSLRKGRTLFREGGESEGLVLVRTGALAVKSTHSGDSEDECRIATGGVVGALSLASVGGRETTAIALENCELWVLERTAYRRLVDDYPRTACRLIEALLTDLASQVRAAIPELD